VLRFARDADRDNVCLTNPVPIGIFFCQARRGTVGESAARPGLVQVLDGEGMERTITRMAAEIVERDGGEIMLVGIHTRGIPLANRLAVRISIATGRQVPVGRLDISLYRDDVGPWRPAHRQPVLKETVLPKSIDDRVVYLIDDVLFTGRTIRAALGTLIDYGRPRAVRLAVLVDRGHRELPIAADVFGKQVSTRRDEDVQVRVDEVDGEDGVWVGLEASDVD
jgi:pyrimidine operon attenuation protein/uracil phosphoribosyltransferase